MAKIFLGFFEEETKIFFTTIFKGMLVSHSRLRFQEKSFENLENYWLKEIKDNAPQNAVLLLVGNKADLDSERKVTFDRAEKQVMMLLAYFKP